MNRTTERRRQPCLPIISVPTRKTSIAWSFLALFAALGITFTTASCSDADGIRITGKLLWANGLPATQIRLRLETGDDVVYARSDDEGRYQFVAQPSESGGLVRAYVSATVGETRFNIVVESEGPDVEVPTASEWKPFTRVDRDGGDLSVAWSPLTSDDAPTYSVRVSQEGGGAWWELGALRDTAFVLPEAVSENHSLSLSLSATIGSCPIFEFVLPRPGEGPHSGACVQEWTNSITSLPLGSSRPLSVGAGCTAQIDGADEPLLTLGQPPCPLTDGLAATAMFECAASGCAQAIIIDLGAETTVGLVVLHGGELEDAGDRLLVVETSTDGMAYSPASMFNVEPYPFFSLYALIAFDHPVVARFVRIRPAGGTFRRLGDVSVF
jgi:hypothetical protein